MPNAPWHQTATVLHGEGRWRGWGRRKLYVLFTRNNTSKLDLQQNLVHNGSEVGVAVMPSFPFIALSSLSSTISSFPSTPTMSRDWPFCPWYWRLRRLEGQLGGWGPRGCIHGLCAVSLLPPDTRTSRCLSGSTSLLHGQRPRRFACVQLIGVAASSVRLCDCHCSKCKYLWWQELLRQV